MAWIRFAYDWVSAPPQRRALVSWASIEVPAAGPAGNALGTTARDSLTVAGQAITGQAGALGTTTRDTITVTGRSITGNASALGTTACDTLTVASQVITGNAGALGSTTRNALTVTGRTITGTGASGAVAATGTTTSDSLTVTGRSVTGQANALGTTTTDTLAVVGQAITASIIRTTRVQDSFTDTAGVNLTAHTGELGATWHARAGTTSGHVISDANRVRNSVAGVSTVVADGVLQGTDHDITGSLRVISDVNTIAGVVGYVTESTYSTYRVYYQDNLTTPRIVLDKVSGGVTGFLGSHDVTFGNGTDSTIRLELRSGSQKVYLNGSLIISAIDTSVPVSTSAGVFGQVAATNTSGLHLDSFLAEDYVVATGDATGTTTRDDLTVTGRSITGQAGALGTTTRDTITVTGKAITAQAPAFGATLRNSVPVTGRAITGNAGALGTTTRDILAVSGQSITASTGSVVNATGTTSRDTLNVSGRSISGFSGTYGISSVDVLAVTGKAITAQASTFGSTSRHTFMAQGQSITGTDGAGPLSAGYFRAFVIG